MKSVTIASEKSEVDKKQYLELVKNFTNYEKENMINYADNNENALIFFNPSNNDLSEKTIKLKQELVNPFLAFRDWLQEEVLDVEAMLVAIKGLYNLLEQENKMLKRDNKVKLTYSKAFSKKKKTSSLKQRKKKI